MVTCLSCLIGWIAATCFDLKSGKFHYARRQQKCKIKFINIILKQFQTSILRPPRLCEFLVWLMLKGKYELSNQNLSTCGYCCCMLFIPVSLIFINTDIYWYIFTFRMMRTIDFRWLFKTNNILLKKLGFAAGKFLFTFLFEALVN